MSILVKGMEMPKSCGKCFVGDRTICADSCPLVEVKASHGRLIDADAPLEKISKMMQEPDYQHEGENWMVGLIMARDAIDEAKPIIKAEGSEE